MTEGYLHFRKPLYPSISIRYNIYELSGETSNASIKISEDRDFSLRLSRLQVPSPETSPKRAPECHHYESDACNWATLNHRYLVYIYIYTLWCTSLKGMKQSFKVSQCQPRHGSARKTRKKTQLSTNKHVDSVFTQQPATCHVLTLRSLRDTGFIFLVSSDFLWNTNFSLDTLMILSAQPWLRRVEGEKKHFSYPYFVWPTLFFFFPPKSHWGGGENRVMPPQPVNRTGNLYTQVNSNLGSLASVTTPDN